MKLGGFSDDEIKKLKKERNGYWKKIKQQQKEQFSTQ